jgi:hypothetical protein
VEPLGSQGLPALYPTLIPEHWGGLYFESAAFVIACCLGMLSESFNLRNEVAIYSVTKIVAGVVAGGCYLAMLGKSFNLQAAVSGALVIAAIWSGKRLRSTP